MSEHHVEAGVRVERGLLEAQLPGGRAIVGVEEGVERSGGLLDCPVPRRAVTGVLLSHYSQVGEAPRDVAAAVRRSVVHDDQLDRLVVLGENALDRLAKVGSGVVHADHHTDERLQGVISSRACSRSSLARSERRSGAVGGRPPVRLDSW